MGAIDIQLKFDGNLTKAEVEQKIRERREEDRDYNGHREGYSGDWQTINNIAFFPEKVFEDENTAIDWCDNNCEKREAVAVKLKTTDKIFWYVWGLAAM